MTCLPTMSSQETIVIDMLPTDNMSYSDSIDQAVGIEWSSQDVLFGQSEIVTHRSTEHTPGVTVGDVVKCSTRRQAVI